MVGFVKLIVPCLKSER